MNITRSTIYTIESKGLFKNVINGLISSSRFLWWIPILWAFQCGIDSARSADFKFYMQINWHWNWLNILWYMFIQSNNKNTLDNSPPPLLNLKSLLRPQGRPFWIFFQPLLNMSENWLLVWCITDLKMIHEKLFKLSRPQGQIIDVKCEKSQLIGHFEKNFSHYWTCPRTTY